MAKLNMLYRMTYRREKYEHLDIIFDYPDRISAQEAFFELITSRQDIRFAWLQTSDGVQIMSFIRYS